MKSHVQELTSYASLNQIVSLEIDRRGADYTASVDALLGAMRESFPALKLSENPVMHCLEQWSPAELAFIIREYSAFSNAAIHMFLEARIRNHWPQLTAEIVRNMDEEYGVLTRNVPHLELMRHGYRVELGIETDALAPTAITSELIRRMTAWFCTGDNAFLAGCLLAFEGTAVEEFRMVEQMLRRYKKLHGGDIAGDSITGVYIAGHVTPEAVSADSDPEMAHYKGMVDAIAPNIDAGNVAQMRRGFFAICLELNRWWESIATEAFLETVRSGIVAAKASLTDVQELFERRISAANHSTAS